jgi:cold shock CspA family protein
MNKLDWLTKVDYIELNSTKPCAAQVKDTSDAAMESLEAMWPLKKGSIKTMRLHWKTGFWFITSTDNVSDIFFHSNFFKGGFSEFEIINERKENGEKINVTYNVENSPKGPMAINVSEVK